MSLTSSRWRVFTAGRRPSFALVLAFAIVWALAVSPAGVAAQLTRSMPDSLSDREFWQFFTTMSEPGGSFVSENFVSNEQTYQDVIPTLQRSLKPGGVYLGVGPEQNFTYIANLEPRMAVIFDIRRQNAMAHLMYKALFELSPTRADFVSRLFSRPLTEPVSDAAAPAMLMSAVMTSRMSDSAFDANRRAIFDQLTKVHGFELTPEDVRSITHVLVSFFEAGPNINYGYRPGMPSFMQGMYATFAQLQSLTNANGVNMAFLANEANYRLVRGMHRKNLIIPVVGDFAGSKAIRGVGEYLRARNATVTAFYLSNVEQYLFRGFGDAERFYHNVETLPIDSTSTFIRSVPPFGASFGSTISILGGPSFAISSGPSRSYSVRVVDSAGVNIVSTTTIDSTGKEVTTRSIDSTTGPRRSPLEIFRSLRARDDSLARAQSDSSFRAALRDTTAAGTRASALDSLARRFVNGSLVVGGGGTLASGIASMRRSLDAFAAGKLADYDKVITMTQTSGWKQP
jgi:hypothetical protein